MNNEPTQETYIMINLSLREINNAIRTLNQKIETYTDVSKNAILSSNKQSIAMAWLTGALVFVGIAQVLIAIFH